MNAYSLQLYSNRKRAFCIEADIGFVKNGKFVVVEYDEERFSQLVSNVIASKKACKPEDVLRKAILIYVEAQEMATKYKNLRINESSLYNKWLDSIADSADFKKARFIALIRKKQETEKIKQARLMQSIINTYYSEHCKK